MRIAFYAPLKSPTHPIPSGDRRVGRLLMDALAMAGHAVTLASEFRSFEGAGDVDRQSALRDEGSRQSQSLIDHWRDGAEQDRPELWFTYHLYYKAPDWLGPQVSRALGIPYVVAEASYAAKRATSAWATGHAAVRMAIQSADLVLCPTHDDIEGLQQIVSDPGRVMRLPPFLDPAPYRQAAQSRAAHRATLGAARDLPAEQPWMVVVAMMRSGDKLESYRLLALALKQLMDLQWHMLVVGDGPARTEVHAVLFEAAPGRVHFMGECDAQAVARAYAASDICIWPSVNEAYGMAMLEAQAAGIPVVSCAVRGVPDVVCDGVTGLLARSGDAVELADKARALLTDVPRRVAMGEAAARFVLDERSTLHASLRLRSALASLPSRHPAMAPLP